MVDRDKWPVEGAYDAGLHVGKKPQNTQNTQKSGYAAGLHVILPRSIAGRAKLARYTLRVPI